MAKMHVGCTDLRTYAMGTIDRYEDMRGPTLLSVLPTWHCSASYTSQSECRENLGKPSLDRYVMGDDEDTIYKRLADKNSRSSILSK